MKVSLQTKTCYNSPECLSIQFTERRNLTINFTEALKTGKFVHVQCVVQISEAAALFKGKLLKIQKTTLALLSRPFGRETHIHL